MRLVILGFCAGLVVMYLYVQPKLSYRGKTAEEWAKKDSLDLDMAASFAREFASTSDQLASASAEIKTLRTVNTALPAIKYVTPSHPNLSTCSAEGDFFYCKEDGCYYHPNGTPTGLCKVGPQNTGY